MAELREALKSKTYAKPCKARHDTQRMAQNVPSVSQPSAGRVTPIMAVKLVIEPILEANFIDTSYGFRPKKSAHDAITKT